MQHSSQWIHSKYVLAWNRKCWVCEGTKSRKIPQHVQLSPFLLDQLGPWGYGWGVVIVLGYGD